MSSVVRDLSSFTPNYDGLIQCDSFVPFQEMLSLCIASQNLTWNAQTWVGMQMVVGILCGEPIQYFTECFFCGPKILVLSCYPHIISTQEVPASNMDWLIIGIDIVKGRS